MLEKFTSFTKNSKKKDTGSGIGSSSGGLQLKAPVHQPHVVAEQQVSVKIPQQNLADLARM